MEGVYSASAKATAKTLGSDFVKVNERAAAYAKKRSAQLVKDVSETTRTRIANATASAFQKGLDPKALTKKVSGIIGNPARAANIAKTELAKAQMGSALDAAEESGLASGKRSLLSNDHDVEDVCDENADAGVILIEDEFPSGDLTAPFHPGGCECDVAIVLL